MTNDAVVVTQQDHDGARPPCYLCGETYAQVDVLRHSEPVSCEVCPRCIGMPACYTCRNMYCACKVTNSEGLAPRPARGTGQGGSAQKSRRGFECNG